MKYLKDLSQEERSSLEELIANNCNGMSNDSLFRLIKDNGFDINKKTVIYLKNKLGLKSNIDTKFKNGNVPPNALAPGTIKFRNETKWVKLADGNWQRYSRYVYEQHHKVKLKNNEKIIFLNNDKNDYDISNLEKVTNKEFIRLLKMNAFSSDKELMVCYITLVKLLCKIKEKKGD